MKLSPFLAAAAFVVAAPAVAAPLDRVVAALGSTQTMVARFEQTDARGRTLAGTLTLKRPGKARFQYAPGVPLLMVADGRSLYFIDYQVRQVERWPIGDAPLRLLLDPKGADVSRVAHVVPSPPGTTAVEARDPRHPEYGTVTLAFRDQAGAPGGLMLEGWTVLDAQNNRSTIRLSDQRFNVAVPDSTFRWVDPRRAGPR